MLGARLLVEGAHFRIVDDREARLQALDRRPPGLPAFERPAEQGQGFRLLSRCRGERQGEVGGRQRRLFDGVVGAPVVVGAGDEAIGRRQPFRRPTAGKARGLGVVERVEGAVQPRGGGDAGAEARGLGDDVGGQEGEVRQRQRRRRGTRGGGDADAAGGGTRERLRGADVRLQEAPAGLQVVGVGAADAVGDAGVGAVVEADAAEDVVVEAGEIGGVEPLDRA